MAIDHYAILGLEYGAAREEIQKAHRKLALRFLPLPLLAVPCAVHPLRTGVSG